jgi:hypothetical protein
MAKKKKLKRLKPRTRRIIGLAMLIVGGAGLALAAQMATNQAGASKPVTIVAVGDISCDPESENYDDGNGTETGCHMKSTSDLALGQNPTAVLALGDLEYENGTLAAFKASYDPTWGRLKPVTKPVPGNHEYNTPGASGYYDYFGAAAGIRGLGYYSYDVGDWHIVALNSNCANVGGCEVSSVQEQWLRADLAAHPKACTLAYWHHPRFSSGGHGTDAMTQGLWQALQDYHADVVLSGHDHDYERFAPQRADGVADPNGITEFVVGTGGKNHDPFRTIRENSLVRNNTDFGILKMTLASTSYSWEFLDEAGAVKDSGSSQCVTDPAASTAVTPQPTPLPTPGR